MIDLAHGSDISFWQDDPDTVRVIDFEKMAEGLDFTIIRAGQNLWKDREFDTSWVNAKAAGIPRGSYWFYDSRADPKRQAEKYVEVLGNDLGELPLFADYEDKYGGQYGTVLHLHDFVERLKALLPGKEIAIYTGYYYWLEKSALLPPKERARLLYFLQYDLWLAWYYIPITEVKAPYPWTEWTFWQYTSSGDGSLYGVESLEIDLNYFNGTKTEFMQKYGLTGTKPPDPPVMKDGQSIRVRIAP